MLSPQGEFVLRSLSFPYLPVVSRQVSRTLVRALSIARVCFLLQLCFGFCSSFKRLFCFFAYLFPFPCFQFPFEASVALGRQRAVRCGACLFALDGFRWPTRIGDSFLNPKPTQCNSWMGVAWGLKQPQPSSGFAACFRPWGFDAASFALKMNRHQALICISFHMRCIKAHALKFPL